MTDKEIRKRFGISGKPLKATRVLVKPMNSGDFNNQEAWCTIVFNDHDGTMTPANHYNGNLGANYQPISRPIPGEDRMKEYLGARGYSWGKVSDFPALLEIDAKTGKPVQAAPAAVK